MRKSVNAILEGLSKGSIYIPKLKIGDFTLTEYANPKGDKVDATYIKDMLPTNIEYVSFKRVLNTVEILLEYLFSKGYKVDTDMTDSSKLAKEAKAENIEGMLLVMGGKNMSVAFKKGTEIARVVVSSYSSMGSFSIGVSSDIFSRVENGDFGDDYRNNGDFKPYYSERLKEMESLTSVLSKVI